jgi:hypothetical protein
MAPATGRRRHKRTGVAENLAGTAFKLNPTTQSAQCKRACANELSFDDIAMRLHDNPLRLHAHGMEGGIPKRNRARAPPELQRSKVPIHPSTPTANPQHPLPIRSTHCNTTHRARPTEMQAYPVSQPWRHTFCLPKSPAYHPTRAAASLAHVDQLPLPETRTCPSFFLPFLLLLRPPCLPRRSRRSAAFPSGWTPC